MKKPMNLEEFIRSRRDLPFLNLFVSIIILLFLLFALASISYLSSLNLNLILGAIILLPLLVIYIIGSAILLIYLESFYNKSFLKITDEMKKDYVIKYDNYLNEYKEEQEKEKHEELKIKELLERYEK